MPFYLSLSLLLFSTGAYYLGRKRAFAVSGGQIRNLHSLPSFYGSYTALWCILPALIVFAPVSYTHLDVYKRQML